MSELAAPTSLSVNLNPQQWDELFENIALAEQMIPGKERREHERRHFETQIALCLHPSKGDDDTHLVRTRNISLSGLGFIHHVEVPTGERVRFTAFTEDRQPHPIDGTVARADLIEDGVWDIGVRFDQLIDTLHLFDANGTPLL